MQRINFHNLETAALKRYRRFYKLPDVGPNSSKEQLVMAVGRHFMAQVCFDITYKQNHTTSEKQFKFSAEQACNVHRLWTKARSLPCSWQQLDEQPWSQGKCSSRKYLELKCCCNSEAELVKLDAQELESVCTYDEGWMWSITCNRVRV